MDEFEKLDLAKVNVKVDNLLLDPNNPRFSKHPDQYTPEHQFDDPEVQETTLHFMLHKRFEINDLCGSIKSKGFVPVDNIFVKKVNGKYVVVEGNRRLTAVRLLLKKHKEGKKKDILPLEILETLQEIECFDLTNNSFDEIDFILGLRHHGSIKQWDFLPSAYNLYKRYMMELCDNYACENDSEEFKYEAKLAKRVAALYSIKLVEVRDKLRAYRAYLQLLEDPNIEIAPGKFSMIHDAIKDKKLREYFGFDEYTCKFSEEGAETFTDLIFETPENKPVILAPASGESSLRDFAYVIKNGTETDVDRIVKDREHASAVKADVRAKLTKRTLLQALEIVLHELEKIPLKEVGALGFKEKEILKKIQVEIDKVNKLDVE